MTRTVSARILTCGATLIAATVLGGSARAATPLTVLTVGDSITCGGAATPCLDGGSYRGRLGQQLTAVGVSVTWRVAAVPGSACGYWASRIGAVLDADRPDLVLVSCGTNDDTSTPAARDILATALRTIWEAVKVRGITLGVSFVGYSDLSLAASWVDPSEARANDVIYTQLTTYYLPVAGWVGGLADFQLISGGPDYLDAGGIHPTAHGYATMADLWYRAMRVTMGWPDTVAQPCGLGGHRIGYAQPVYRSCF